MIGDILFIYWLLLPAGLANMAPVLAKKWRWLQRFDKPLDRDLTWRGRRLFGAHKTWRGLIAGWLLATIFTIFQFWLYDSSSAVRDFYRVDISHLNPLIWGGALALGALGGDTIKSFFKRQLDIQPGKNWVPFDQLDFVAGTLLVTALFLDLPLRFYVIAVLLGLLLHPLFNLLGWVLHLKDKPF